MAVFGSSNKPDPGTAFQTCDACLGRGFLRAGDFADRRFPRCKTCNGIGQIYLEEPPPPPREKLKP